MDQALLISHTSGHQEQPDTDKLVRFEVELEEETEKWKFCPVDGCTFWTRKKGRMERHARCHTPGGKHYKCPDCTLKFYSLAKMLKHDRKCHTGVKDYECRVCDAEVTDIQVHMRVSLSFVTG